MIYKVSKKNKEKIDLLDYIAIEHGFTVNSKEDAIRVIDFIRNELGLKKMEFCRAVGINHSNLSNWFSGKSFPNPASFKKILEYYTDNKE